MTIARRVLQGIRLSGGFRGRIDLDTADPALPFPFETGSAAVEGTLTVTAAATLSAAAVHGVAGTVATTAVAITDITGAHGVAGSLAAEPVTTLTIAGAHGVAGSLAAEAVATLTIAGAHGVAGSLAAVASASVSMTGEHPQEQPLAFGGGFRVRIPREIVLVDPVLGFAEISVTMPVVALTGEALPPPIVEHGTAIVIPIRALAMSRPVVELFPALRLARIEIAAAARFDGAGIFDRERMDELDLLAVAFPPFDLAA